MFLAIHVPMFGTANIESKPIECPTCKRGISSGTNNWREVDVTACEPGMVLTCAECGGTARINWGLVEPDHLSTWINSEHCPHRLCREKYQQLKATLVAAEN
jgi:hypothetical protein